MKTVNPATGETLRTFDELADAELDARIANGAAAAAAYRYTSFDERAVHMHRAAELLEKEKREFGRLMTLEMGKPITAAIAEAEKCAWVCRYYAEQAADHLRAQDVATDAARSYVLYQPLGVVLAIMPWNFPFWQVFRFAAPALMAGNAGLLKHAANVPQCALAIEDIFRRAGFPEDVFQALLIGSDRVARVISDDRVKAVTLTGSEAAGSSVASQAGKLIKKSVLELGGSDPFIVMPTANLASAIETAVKARTVNTGQSCIAAKRFIVHEDVYDEFTAGFVKAMEALVIGDPMDERTQIGPLATEQILKDLEQQVEHSVQRGAHVLTGGQRIDRPGYYYAPTVVADIPEDAPAFAEELFGPVASLFRVRSVHEAIALANATTFGLGSAAWTNDAMERQLFINDIEAGCVFINGMVASDPRLPFGGIKRSGYGRELGVWGIREFVNVKTVWIGKSEHSAKFEATE